VNAIAKLEVQRQQKPNSANVLRALGIAYYKAGRINDARAVLEQARGINPKDGTTALYAGLAAEQAGDLAAARTAYSSYLTFGRTARVRSQLQGRLSIIARKELEQAAKTALANEATLSKEAGDPRTIAVLPLKFSGTDSSLIPLERGIADLIVNDLSKSKLLTIVERERMQAILDEVKLAQSGQVDAATAVRAGKLIRAGRIVQGALTQLPEQSLRIDAAVVDAATSQAGAAASGDDRLDEIFALEKKIVFNLFDAMDIELTAAERKQIEERPTKSLAAFLAYSNGLMAQDNGDLEAASRHYQDAVRADPSFRGASARSQQVQQINTAAATSTAQVETQLSGSAEGNVVAAAEQGLSSAASGSDNQSLASTVAQTAENLNPSANNNALTTSQTNQLSIPPQTPPPGNATSNPAVIPTGVIRIVIPQKP
jgi:TolB-like protein